MLTTTLKEYSKNDLDYLYKLSFLDKLVQNLTKNGLKYKVRKFIYFGFRNYKNIVKIHPLFIYFFIINYFLILIEFKNVRKSGQILKVPVSIIGEEIFILRTIKLFSKTLKNRLHLSEDLQTNFFFELFNLTFFIKRSKFYTYSLSKYYLDTAENMKYISYR